MYLVKFKLNSDMPVKGAERLFFNIEGRAQVVADGAIMPKGSAVALDTFFNNFSANYIKFTNAVNLKAEIIFTGEILAELHFRDKEQDKILRVERLSSNDKTAAYIDVPLARYEEGYLYVKVISCADGAMFYGGGFLTENAARDVKVGIVICTYHREKYVIKNMQCLADYLAEVPNFAGKIDVFVVDNGKTLQQNDLPNFVNLIPNENTGGSGGFVRGLKEVLSKGDDCTHFLFMDDDIIFMPSVINRTVSLISALKDEYSSYSVGGAMLKLSNPLEQYELGSRWLGNALKGNRKDVDVSTVEGLLVNEEQIASDYNAWWYMCMPLELVRKHGLPLEKLFIKCDDVEYGLRAMEGLITVSGIGVWHEDFDSKFSPSLEYFVKRNELIVNSRFPRRKGFCANWWKMFRAIAKALVEYRYFHIDMIEKAYLDFLKGADYLNSVNYTQLFDEIKPLLPVMQDADEFEKTYGINLDEELAKSKSEHAKILPEVLTLNGYLMPKSSYRDMAVVDMVYPKPCNYYRTRKIVSYNAHARQVFVSEIKKSKLFYGLGKIAKITFAMLFKYGRARRSYKNMHIESAEYSDKI